MIKQLTLLIFFLTPFLGLWGCSEDASEATNPTNQEIQSASVEEKSGPEKKGPQPNPNISYDTSGFDIIGISLDMPMKAALAVIQSHTPPMKASMREGDVQSIYGSHVRGLIFPDSFIIAKTTPKRDEIGRIIKHLSEEITVAGYSIPNHGRVSAVGRFTGFENDVLLTEMRELLISKYGQPTFEQGALLSWSLKPDGSAQTDTRIITDCSRGHTKNKKGPEVPGVVAYKSDLNPDHYAHCGFTFVVQMQQANNPSLVKWMHTVLYDFNAIKQSNKETIAYTKIEANKMRAAEREKATGATKPKL